MISENDHFHMRMEVNRPLRQICLFKSSEFQMKKNEPVAQSSGSKIPPPQQRLATRLRPARGADLQESRRASFLFQDLQGLLQPLYLSLTAPLALSIRLRLRDAHRLQLLPILHDRSVLGRRALLVLLQTDQTL